MWIDYESDDPVFTTTTFQGVTATDIDHLNTRAVVYIPGEDKLLGRNYGRQTFVCQFQNGN